MALMSGQMRAQHLSSFESTRRASSVLACPVSRGRVVSSQLTAHRAPGHKHSRRDLLQQLLVASPLLLAGAAPSSATLAAPDSEVQTASTSPFSRGNPALDPPTYVRATGRIVAGELVAACPMLYVLSPGRSGGSRPLLQLTQYNPHSQLETCMETWTRR